MISSTPREVNGKWYPVPCPEGISIGQSFPSYEACLAACETSGVYEERLGTLEIEYDERLERDVEEATEDEYDRGRDDGRDEGREAAREECEEGTCPGYDVGWADGYAQGKELARSAETA